MHNLLRLSEFRDFLATIPPLYGATPWLALALVFFFIDYALHRFGWAALVERKWPFGKLLTETIKRGPLVVVGALWPALSSGDLSLASGAQGAVEALTRPLILAVGAWFLSKKLPKETVRLEEHGFVRIKLMLGIALLCLVSCTVVPVLAGCSPQGAKTAAHLASNGVAEALSWFDGRLTPQFKAASEAKIKQLAAEGKPLSAWEAWKTESGWTVAINTVALAHDAQAMLAGHLAGTVASTHEQRQKAFELVSKALNLGLDLLEKEHVEVPVYVRAGVQQLPALGALL